MSKLFKSFRYLQYIAEEVQSRVILPLQTQWYKNVDDMPRKNDSIQAHQDKCIEHHKPANTAEPFLDGSK